MNTKRSNKIGKHSAYEYHLLWKCQTDQCEYETVTLGRFDSDEDAFKYALSKYHVDSYTKLARNIDIEAIYKLCGAAKMCISTDRPTIN